LLTLSTILPNLCPAGSAQGPDLNFDQPMGTTLEEAILPVFMSSFEGWANVNVGLSNNKLPVKTKKIAFKR